MVEKEEENKEYIFYNICFKNKGKIKRRLKKSCERNV